MNSVNTFFSYFFQCIEATKNISAKHDEEDDNDLFTKSLQAKWFNSLSNTLVSDISGSLKNNRGAFDPKVLVQKMIDVLREESTGGGPEVNDLFYESLEELKTDPDFSAIMTEFDDALNGRQNMMTIGLLAGYFFKTDISCVILLHEKFLQFDWLRAVVFQLNLKYLHVKITNLLQVVI